MYQLPGRVNTPRNQHIFTFVVTVLTLAGMFLLWQNRQSILSIETERPAAPRNVSVPVDRAAIPSTDRDVIVDYLRNTIKSIDSATGELTRSQKTISQVLPYLETEELGLQQSRLRSVATRNDAILRTLLTAREKLDLATQILQKGDSQ